MALDPARYGYSFDMFTQITRAFRAGGPSMGGLKPKQVWAIGESKSAIALTTCGNGV